MGRVIRGAELLGEEAGQRLHLVTPGKQRELLGVGSSNFAQPLQYTKGFIPADFGENAVPPFRARFAQQGLGEPRRRVLLHDAGSAFRADHAFVQGMIGIAIDVTHLTITQVYADAAATRAHVAGSGLYFQLSDPFGQRLDLQRCGLHKKAQDS